MTELCSASTSELPLRFAWRPGHPWDEHYHSSTGKTSGPHIRYKEMRELLVTQRHPSGRDAIVSVQVYIENSHFVVVYLDAMISRRRRLRRIMAAIVFAVWSVFIVPTLLSAERIIATKGLRDLATVLAMGTGLALLFWIMQANSAVRSLDGHFR